MAKAPSPKAPSKSEVMANMATATGLTKKQITSVFDALTAEIGKALGKKGPGVFQIPGLCKIVRKHVPAKKAQKGVLNRLTGKVEDRPAKPASTTVRVRALKSLKGMV